MYIIVFSCVCFATQTFDVEVLAVCRTRAKAEAEMAHRMRYFSFINYLTITGRIPKSDYSVFEDKHICDGFDFGMRIIDYHEPIAAGKYSFLPAEHDDEEQQEPDDTSSAGSALED